MEKKRKYIEEYINLGFTSLLNDGAEKPQCVLCHVVLSAESLKLSKLKRHVEAKHPQHAKKNTMGRRLEKKTIYFVTHVF